MPKNPSRFSEEWSLLLSAYAFALWKTGDEKDAMKRLCESIRFDKHNQYAQRLMREMGKANEFSKSNYYRILVHGKWPKPLVGGKKNKLFFTTYDVVADDLEEAMAFIRKYEPREVRPSLAIEESKKLNMHKQPKGVYKTTGYAFYNEGKS